MVTDDNYLIQSVDVSVIVITFNPNLNKLYKTLDSIINQIGICYEIIVCDDGSQLNFEDKIRLYFSSKSFNRFSLVFNNHHCGTVSNYYSGLKVAKGKYTKVISSGDWIAGPTILAEWIKYLERSGREWSFSDIFTYGYESGKEKWFRLRAYPQQILPYNKQNDKKCIWNYIVLQENANGSSFLGTTQIQQFYCKTIMDKGVKYVEDTMYFVMMFNGVVGCYFPKAAICYEYGTGISTTKNAYWKDALRRDNMIVRQMMAETLNLSPLQQSIVKTFERTKKIEKLFIKGKVFHWLKWRFFPRMTKIPKTSDINGGR